MKTFRVVDFETTGIPTELERHAIVEAGWCDVIMAPEQDPYISEPHSMLVNPGRPIPPIASAVHHIRDRDVAGAPSPDRALMTVGAAGDVYVAHKADFEQQFFGGGDRPWICTWKIALRLWPALDGHKLQELRYQLGMDDWPAFEADLAQPAHRAGPDTYATAHLFVEAMKHMPVDDMIRLTKSPALLVMCYMNKHRGTRWRDVAAKDPSYLRWIVDKSDIEDRDIRATAKYYLKHPPAKSGDLPL